MNDNIISRRPKESIPDWLLRLGSMKEAGVIPHTWAQLTDILNNEISAVHAPMDESSWRKRYRKLLFDRMPEKNSASVFVRINNAPNTEPAPVEHNESKKVVEETTIDPESNKNLDEKMLLGEKIKVQVRDERTALNRKIRNDARNDALMDLFRTEIRKYDANKTLNRDYSDLKLFNDNQAVYAMLSDIHYGIAYDSSAGKYNSSVARDRVLRYADAIADVGELHTIDTCYISLLGDLISGNIHNAIRVENRENVVQQVVGVSELIAEFLYDLAGKFIEVHVNAVSGNHSRLDLNADDALRGDKLDELVPWYCKTKLANCKNVIWHDNEIDATISNYNIFGVNYVAVHGDYDANLQKSAMLIERMTREPIDYILAGHMHVPELRLETVGTIRNGSVCGSGDEFTMKKRLFGYPYQVCLVVDEKGVRDYIPIAL